MGTGNLRLLDREPADFGVDVVLDGAAAGQPPAQQAELEELENIDLVGEPLEIARAHARCVERAHHGSHARSYDEIGLHARIVERLQHADVRETAGSAGTKHQRKARRGTRGLREARLLLLPDVRRDVAAGERQGEAGDERAPEAAHQSQYAFALACNPAISRSRCASS